MDDIKGNEVYLDSLAEHHNIVCIQEHWLHSFEKSHIQERYKNHNYAMKYSNRRGSAGICTMWKKEHNHHIVLLEEGSNRTAVIVIGSNPLTVVINTYIYASR